MRITFTLIPEEISKYLKLLLFLSFLFSLNTLWSQPDFYVANRDGNNVLRYTMDGVYVEEFVRARSGGLSSPQEVLFHPVDGSLLVTGFNNAEIKRYDGKTGSYLGNFSKGFTLQGATKMIIGKDSLIYVTQWRSNQPRIVRFDLEGNFIDEWSDIVVREGCGMAWDKDGNLLVTTWSDGQNNGLNGFVRKFDPNGKSLGIAINTNVLQGPVGIWVDENDVIFVVDWTAGAVRRFDQSGNFLGNFISGMTRTEGNVVGPDGKYYLCDWQANRVNRYNADGTFDRTLVSSGLNIPNGITFGPVGITSTSMEPQRSISEVNVFPNPASSTINIKFTAHDSEPLSLQITDILGRAVLGKTLKPQSGYNQYPLDISNYNKGLYFITLSQRNVVRQTTFSLF